MELKKIASELPQHVQGDRKFKWFRGREIDVPKLQREFAQFIDRFPYDRARQRALDFKSRSHSQDIALILAQLERAIRERKGFSFLRMGDGEGRFVGLARTYPNLYDQSKRIAKHVWYKYSEAPGEDFYNALEEAYKNASIAGYVPAYRLALEAPNVWYGYFGCVSGNEFIHAKRRNDNQHGNDTLVRNWANVELIERKSFAQLLTGVRTGLITCHSNPQIFLDKFNLPEVEHIVITPEPHPLLENRSNRPLFYPGHFEEILKQMAKSDTQLYLIGAGVYAKLFCEQLRKLGKIGLDVGSTLDQIAGFATRPASVRESEYHGGSR